MKPPYEAMGTGRGKTLELPRESGFSCHAPPRWVGINKNRTPADAQYDATEKAQTDALKVKYGEGTNVRRACA